MMNWWLEKGVDGFRMDVISLISKEPGLPDYEPETTGYAAYNAGANGPVSMKPLIISQIATVFCEINFSYTIPKGSCCKTDKNL